MVSGLLDKLREDPDFKIQEVRTKTSYSLIVWHKGNNIFNLGKQKCMWESYDRMERKVIALLTNKLLILKLK